MNRNEPVNNSLSGHVSLSVAGKLPLAWGISPTNQTLQANKNYKDIEWNETSDINNIITNYININNI